MSKPTLMLLLPLAALCLPACAQDATPVQGMVVVRDAQTGQLRTPTPAEMRALQPAPLASILAPVQPSITTGPGGRRSVRLGESRMVYSVVARDAEGKLGEQCVHGVHTAERAAQGDARPAPNQEEPRHESR